MKLILLVLLFLAAPALAQTPPPPTDARAAALAAADSSASLLQRLSSSSDVGVLIEASRLLGAATAFFVIAPAQSLDSSAISVKEMVSEMIRSRFLPRIAQRLLDGWSPDPGFVTFAMIFRETTSSALRARPRR